ncbi:MAG: MFS transporter [Catenulispora sp.]
MPRLLDGFRRAQAAVAAQFLLLGFQYASWASRLPAIKARLGLTDAEVGALLTTCGIGATAAFPLVAALIKRFGSAAVCVGAVVPLAFVPLALGAAPDYPVALAITCVDGVALACLDVAMNAQGAQLEEEFERKTIGRLHATFSAGALLGALLASAVTAATANLTVHFAIVAALMLALSGYARTSLLPSAAPEPSPGDTAPDEGASGFRIKIFLPTRTTLWIGAAIAFATIVEGALNDWSALYLKNVAKAAAGLTPIGIAVFSVSMVVARIFSDAWRKRWGDARVVIAGSALAGVSLAIAVLLGGVAPALAGFGLAGLGIAAVAPCIYVAAARLGTEALALVSAMGTVGLLIGPGAIGLIADAGGLAWAMGSVAGTAVLVALSACRISWRSAPGGETADGDVAGYAAESPAAGLIPAVDPQHAT